MICGLTAFFWKTILNGNLTVVTTSLHPPSHPLPILFSFPIFSLTDEEKLLLKNLQKIQIFSCMKSSNQFHDSNFFLHIKKNPQISDNGVLANRGTGTEKAPNTLLPHDG